jgi:hypothetical protein
MSRSGIVDLPEIGIRIENYDDSDRGSAGIVIPVQTYRMGNAIRARQESQLERK